MQSIPELRGRVQARQRSARHLLAENGARRWSGHDQAAFDSLLDDADRAQALLDARQSNAGSAAAQWARQREGLELFMRKGFKALNDHERLKVFGAMSTTTGSEGGYTVSPLVAGDLLDMLKGYGWMRQVAADITTLNGSDLGYPTSNGTAETGELVPQNTPATAGDPSFNTRPMNTFKYSSMVFTVPVELLQDSAVDIVMLIMQRARDRIGRVQNLHFTTGTGTGQPTGLVTAASVGKVGTTGQTLTITYDDLADLADSIDEAQLGMPDRQIGMPEVTPGWMLSQTMRKVVRKLKDTAGRPIWMPAIGSERPQLMDYPVYINNDMPVPAANAKSLAFGNLRSYLVRDALDVTLFRFEDSAFALKGQVGFLAWARAAGNLLDTGAVKVYQHSAT